MTTEIDELDQILEELVSDITALGTDHANGAFPDGKKPDGTFAPQNEREAKAALNKWALAQAELARMNELDRLENQLMKAHGRLSEFEAQYLTKRRAELEGMK